MHNAADRVGILSDNDIDVCIDGKEQLLYISWLFESFLPTNSLVDFVCDRKGLPLDASAIQRWELQLDIDLSFPLSRLTGEKLTPRGSA